MRLVSKKFLSRIAFGLGFLLVPISGQAGQVLPPTNLSACTGNNTVLTWSAVDGGSIVCQSQTGFPTNHGLIGQTNFEQGCRAFTDAEGNAYIQLSFGGAALSSHLAFSNSSAWPGGGPGICLVDNLGLSITDPNGNAVFYSW